MDDYWNKMQQRFLEASQNQSNQINTNDYVNAISQQIPREISYGQPQAASNIQRFDGIIEPNQGHYGFNEVRRSSSHDWTNFLKEEVSPTAKLLSVIVIIIWIFIIIMFFAKNV